MTQKTGNKTFGYNREEIKIFRKLNTPAKVQDFLETLRINFEHGGETCMSPRVVLRTQRAHCMEGAMLAAAVLEYHGHRPLVIDLRARRPDDDHVVCVFRQFGCWGGIAKTNHAVLRYREPVYRSVRELVLSYFHEYFTHDGRKTLREYTMPISLARFDRLRWRTAEGDLFDIPQAIDKSRHVPILSEPQIKNLRRADPIEIRAGKLVEWNK